MMKKTLLLFMMLLLSIPVWAGEQTVVINRNEGQFEEGNGVYYCTKGGVMMTFTSGLNNPNYLVEHQQVYFEVRSVNTEYIIKKIVFHCVDNTTDDNLDCFYWGPSTISIVQNWYNPSAPGTYTYSGYTGTWTGETNKIQFTTEAKPVRFGSVEITYEKEVGDVYDLVTSESQLQAGEKYILVNQYYAKGMSSFMNTSYNSQGRTDVSFVEGTNKHKVIVNDSIKIMTLQASGDTDRPWHFAGGNNTYLRRSASTAGSATAAVGYTLDFEGIGNYPEYFPVKIEIGTEANNYRALIRFAANSTSVPKPTDTQYAIGHNNTYKYFKALSYTGANADTYSSYQRVYLYMPARNYIITTECDPTAGGFITLGEGVLELDGNQTSQQFQTVKFFVGTNEGYGIGSVIATDGGGNPVELTCTSESPLGNNYTLVMPAANVHIVATFVDPYEIHTDCTPEYGGEFNFNSGAIDLNNTYISNEGKVVNFTVSPSLGYVFTGLMGTNDTDGSDLNLIDNGDGTYSFTMPANDVTLSATFDRVIGDIFDLVTSTSQIVDGNTYIIVSQYHDKVMKHWNRAETTFQGTPIVEWTKADKSQVRVDDNACFFRLDKDNATGNPAGFLNTLVGYIGYGGFNGATGNVVSTPDQSGYNHATMYISGSSTGEKNYLCTFDSIGNNNMTIRYEAASNSFRIISYSNSTDERVWLYKLADSYHNISTVCNPPQGGSINVSATSAQAGETVTFTVTTNEYYVLENVTVTYTDGTQGTIEVTLNGGTYSFVMPEGAVTITANFKLEDLYLLGTALGKTWAPKGPKFNVNYETEEYYLDVYFKGIRQGLNWTNGDDRYGYFSLTTMISENNDWNAIAGSRIYPGSNDELIQQGEAHNVYRNNSGHAFKIEAGIYRITVNKEKTSVTVSKTPVSLAITDPEDGANVALGTQVNWTSNVQELVNAIADQYDDVARENATSDYNLNNTGKTIGTSATLTQVGFNTIVADAWIGYIEASDAATYNVVDAPELYLLGWHNGATEFQRMGTLMNYDLASDTYSIMVYYKGVRQNFDYTSGDMMKGYFHFSTIQDNTGYGYDYTSHFLTADYNDYPVTAYEEGETPTMHHLNEGTGSTNAFEIDPGVYTIYVKGDKSQMWVERHPLLLDLTPVGGVTAASPVYVTYGTPVTATSGMEAIIKGINDDEVDQTFMMSTDGGTTWTNTSTVSITTPGTTPVEAQAYIGYIVVDNRGFYAYTPLNYIENPDNPVGPSVVCDTLVGTWAVANGNTRLLWAKDIGNRSIDKTQIITGEDGQADYVKDILHYQTKDWDQSNWVVINFANVDGDPEAFVGKAIAPLTIKGQYADKVNYTINLTSPLTEQHILNDVDFSNNYPGYLGDYQEQEEGVDYLYNHYVAANFMTENLNAPYGSGFIAGSDAYAPFVGEKLYFMNPKVREVAHVMGVWNGQDQFTVYERDLVNNCYNYSGMIDVDWTYNRIGQMAYSRPVDLIADTAYVFHMAIELKTSATLNGAKPGSPSARYKGYPLDLPGRGAIPTGVVELANGKTIDSVRYYNLMGAESAEPFQGINIVVTRYTDGSTTAVKILK